MPPFSEISKRVFGWPPAMLIFLLINIPLSAYYKFTKRQTNNTFFSGKQNYLTDPAKLTSESQNIDALFIENILSNIDTLQLTKTAAGSLNSMIFLQYSFPKWDVGFNIDALGISFGNKQSGKFIASESKSLNGSLQNAKPASFNLLFISDIGSLTSELYARYWVFAQN